MNIRNKRNFTVLIRLYYYVFQNIRIQNKNNNNISESILRRGGPLLNHLIKILVSPYSLPFHHDQFYSLSACACSDVGATTNLCDKITGQCVCRPNVGERQCDKCIDNYYELTTEGCTGIVTKFISKSIQ